MYPVVIVLVHCQQFDLVLSPCTLFRFNYAHKDWEKLGQTTSTSFLQFLLQLCIEYLNSQWATLRDLHNSSYYMEESVLLGTKPLVDSIRHFIRDPSGVFSVCHLCECRIVQWRHDSRLLLLLNWFLHIIKRTLHVGSKIWILCSRGKNNISLVRFAHSWDIVLATRT